MIYINTNMEMFENSHDEIDEFDMEGKFQEAIDETMNILMDNQMDYEIDSDFSSWNGGKYHQWDDSKVHAHIQTPLQIACITDDNVYCDECGEKFKDFNLHSIDGQHLCDDCIEDYWTVE